jgi:hypothetical protein
MRIESFSLHGLANYVEPAVLAPLEDVNVLYGPNNAGKSNLLRAVELYFRLLGAGESVTQAQRQILDNPDPALQALLAGSFCRTAPLPIVFAVEWSLPEHDLRLAGLQPDYPCSRITTVLEVESMNRTTEVRIRKWLLENQDVAGLDRAKEPALLGFAQQLRRLLADAEPFRREQPVLPVVTLGASGELFPQALRDALFDARVSRDPEQRKRWALFAELAATMQAELGPGAWETTFERAAGQADLVYLRGEETVTLESLGAGVRRLTALLAELALTNAGWVLLEEPEWRLSPALQKRLVTLARRVVAAGSGPKQLFLTTHSPTLAALGAPFAVEPGELSPVVSRKPWALSPDTDGIDDGAPAPVEGEGLGQLIGLVDSLAELEPEQLLAAAGAARGSGRA